MPRRPVRQLDFGTLQAQDDPWNASQPSSHAPSVREYAGSMNLVGPLDWDEMERAFDRAETLSWQEQQQQDAPQQPSRPPDVAVEHQPMQPERNESLPPVRHDARRRTRAAPLAPSPMSKHASPAAMGRSPGMTRPRSLAALPAANAPSRRMPNFYDPPVREKAAARWEPKKGKSTSASWTVNSSVKTTQAMKVREYERNRLSLKQLRDKGGPGGSVVEQLLLALAEQFGRVLEVFKEWDDDENGLVSAKEFRQALPLLGLKCSRADAETLFASLDADGSGEIDYSELHRQLNRELTKRGRGEIELGSQLQDGAVAFDRNVQQGFELRKGLGEARSKTLGGGKLVAGDGGTIADQLRRALDANLARVIDLFREWDDDGSGEISAKEFFRALPVLGLSVSRADSDALFNSFDMDGSGTVEYSELSKRIKATRAPVARRKWVDPSTVPLESIPDEDDFKGYVREARQRERDALARLARVQRELRRVKSLSAMDRHHERTRAAVAAVHADLDERVGRDVTRRIAQVQAASEPEMVLLSQQLNAKMCEIFEYATACWYKIYLLMDEDRSGRISYQELWNLVRYQLLLTPDVLPEVKLEGLWKSLDTDASGYIDVGEFGAFMRKGEPQENISRTAKENLTWKEKQRRLMRQGQKKNAAAYLTNGAESIMGKADKFENQAMMLEESLDRAIRLAGSGHSMMSFPAHSDDFDQERWRH